MTGGQSIDLDSEGKRLSQAEVERMFSLKTGALIHAAVVSACLLAEDLDFDGAPSVFDFPLYGAIAATMQTDLKRLVAYSSVAHLGFIVLGTFAFTTQAITGSVMQMVNHGISTGALFLMVGWIYERRHTRQIAELSGLQKVAPIFAAGFMVVMLDQRLQDAPKPTNGSVTAEELANCVALRGHRGGAGGRGRRRGGPHRLPLRAGQEERDRPRDPRQGRQRRLRRVCWKDHRHDQGRHHRSGQGHQECSP